MEFYFNDLIFADWSFAHLLVLSIVAVGKPILAFM